jgi:hypothetical protein
VPLQHPYDTQHGKYQLQTALGGLRVALAMRCTLYTFWALRPSNQPLRRQATIAYYLGTRPHAWRFSLPRV